MVDSDFFKLNDLFTEDELFFASSLREFTDKEIIPVIDKHYQEGTYPKEITQKLAEMGVFGITIPEEYGGAGAGYVMYGLAMQELERGDSAVRSFASVQSSLVMYPIFKYGSEEQKKKWLPKLATV